MEKTDKKTPPPYVTYKSFSNFINDLREHGMPTHITRTILPGSNSGKATMAASLRSLGLINGDDEPTAMLEKLTTPDIDYSKTLNEIIISHYDFLSDPEFDIKNTTTEKVVERIKGAGASGSTITKCMSFLISACDEAGIEVSKYVKAPAPVRTAGNGKRKSKTKAADQQIGQADAASTTELTDQIPENMERITVPLRGKEDGVIYFPAELEPGEAKKAVRMAVFILNEFYGLEDE